MTDTASRPRLQAVTSALLHEQVARQLRQLILDGVLAPGSRLSERQLGDQLGVSRTPLREALRALAGEGLVELLPRRGAQVARLRPEDVAHIFPVMEALEALAGALACEAMTDAQISHARGLHQRLVAAYKAGDEDAFFTHNRQIHEHILAGAGNPVLLKIYEGLSGQMRRARYMALNNKKEWRLAVAEHEMIIDALTNRDSERLSAALSTHLKSKREKIIKNLVTDAPANERRVTGAGRLHR